MNDSFTYKVINIDHIKGEYTLKNLKNGRIKVVSKEDFDFYVSEAKKVKKQKSSLSAYP
jgi:hypothetical protein